MTHADVNHTTATHHLLTGRPCRRRGAAAPTTGRATARCWRSWAAARGPLPPFVSMMPVVPDGAPRFVEESHGQGAGWLGPVYDPMRIDADASKPDYRVGDFAPARRRAAVRVDGRRGAAAVSSTASVRGLDAGRACGDGRALPSGPSRCWPSPAVAEAFDLSQRAAGASASATA